ncbi:kinase-like domain-containing protein [Mycena metata]|uniref:non-specific serine/threonine protein kinase n=1 Tax=Mycena metata TaxID=1033252 RepID=A0AAD7NLL8_9AGAR|nr:kinase-like domain-containing protein [Mycena metata]
MFSSIVNFLGGRASATTYTSTGYSEFISGFDVSLPGLPTHRNDVEAPRRMPRAFDGLRLLFVRAVCEALHWGCRGVCIKLQGPNSDPEYDSEQEEGDDNSTSQSSVKSVRASTPIQGTQGIFCQKNDLVLEVTDKTISTSRSESPESLTEGLCHWPTTEESIYSIYDLYTDPEGDEDLPLTTTSMNNIDSDRCSDTDLSEAYIPVKDECSKTESDNFRKQRVATFMAARHRRARRDVVCDDREVAADRSDETRDGDDEICYNVGNRRDLGGSVLAINYGPPSIIGGDTAWVRKVRVREADTIGTRRVHRLRQGLHKYDVETTSHPVPAFSTANTTILTDRGAQFVLCQQLGKSATSQVMLARASFLEPIDSAFLTPLLRAFEDEWNVYFVMRLYPETMAQRLQDLAVGGRLSLKEIRLYAAELVCALGTLHEDQYVLRRDLRLDNILLSPSGHLCLADFGSAVRPIPIGRGKLSEKVSTAGTTPAYLAPEVFAGTKTKFCGTALDIWAFGMLLLELFEGTGKPHFEGRERDCRVAAVPDADVQQLVQDRDAADLIDRIVNRGPLDRLKLSQIRDHRFFDPLFTPSETETKIKTNAFRNWDIVENRGYKPRYRPDGPLRYRADSSMVSTSACESTVTGPFESSASNYACAPGMLYDPLH